MPRLLHAFHRGCGGQLYESEVIAYDYSSDDYPHDPEAPSNCSMPALFCWRCGNEILGDAEIQLTDELDEDDEDQDEDA